MDVSSRKGFAASLVREEADGSRLGGAGFQNSAAYTISDVSPDLPHGVVNGFPNTGGRIISVVADPFATDVVYAASQYAGVWKSTNRGQTWLQASRGLRTGYTQASAPPALACDPVRRSRLIYVTVDDDQRPTVNNRSPFGGLYLSTNGALNWTHIPLPAPPRSPIAFGVDSRGRSHGCVLTNGGLLLSTNEALTAWGMAPGPLGSDGRPLRIAYFAVDGDTVFAASGRTIYRASLSTLVSRIAVATLKNPWEKWQGVELPTDASIERLAIAPTAPGSVRRDVVLAMYRQGDLYRVGAFNFANRVHTDLRFDRPPTGSGTSVLVVGRAASLGLRPPNIDGPGGTGIEIFVGDTLDFYRYQSVGNWKKVPNIHVDTWAIAFPANYDPPRGIVTVYAAHDGGVSVRTNAGNDIWVCAMSGLHAYKTGVMAGINRTNPVLYVPSGDNEGWVSRTGGVPGTSWLPIGNLGDQGKASVDATGLIGQLSLMRNGILHVYRSTTPLTTPALPSDTNYYAIIARDNVNADVDPSNPTYSQIQTLPSESPAPEGDYIAVRNTGLLVRSQDGGKTWMNISRLFRPNSIKALVTSGGHRAPVIYFVVQDSPGTNPILFKGEVDANNGLVTKLTALSRPAIPTAPVQPINPIVNPYDPNILYVTDLNDKKIKSSRDGGATWRNENELTRIATNNGEYRFDTWSEPAGLGTFAPLQTMVFVPQFPEFRVAVLFPVGIVISRHHGNPGRWKRIDENLRGVGDLAGVTRLDELLARPFSAFISGNFRARDRFKLYLGLVGRGVVCIEGPFTEP